MNILLINYEYPPIGGGAATATAAIAGHLASLGHAVTVLTSRFRDLKASWRCYHFCSRPACCWVR